MTPCRETALVQASAGPAHIAVTTVLQEGGDSSTCAANIGRVSRKSKAAGKKTGHFFQTRTHNSSMNTGF